MNSAQSNKLKDGFTLIEILVVMSIIAVLAGMVFAGATGAMNTAKKIDATNTCANLKTAITTYFTDYRKVPTTEGGLDDNYVDYDTEKNEDFMNILLGASEDRNPRGTVFFDGKTAKGGRNGVILNSDGGGRLTDPWGNGYQIRIDLTSKGRVPSPEDDSTLLSETVAIYSFGKVDGSNDNPSKSDIKNWAKTPKSW